MPKPLLGLYVWLNCFEWLDDFCVDGFTGFIQLNNNPLRTLLYLSKVFTHIGYVAAKYLGYSLVGFKFLIEVFEIHFSSLHDPIVPLVFICVNTSGVLNSTNGVG